MIKQLIHNHIQDNNVERNSQHQSKSDSVLTNTISFHDKCLLYYTGEKRMRKTSGLNFSKYCYKYGHPHQSWTYGPHPIHESFQLGLTKIRNSTLCAQ